MFDEIDFDAAVGRLAGVIKRTPLEKIACPDDRIDLRLKLESVQETGSFKCRGAWNNVSQLTPVEAAAGIVTTSSGNHGRALSWAARRAGVAATIVMANDAYPNKIAACREQGAEVILTESLQEAEDVCGRLVAGGRTLVHPYDARGTVEGAGTVGLEIAEDWPEVEVVAVPVGGGGLIAGTSLALRRTLGTGVVVFGAEPEGANSMTLGLAAGEQVTLDGVTTAVQGLCPLDSGRLNIAICLETLSGMFDLEDGEILDAQRMLVHGGHVVEPAGAAAVALVLSRRLAHLFEGRSSQDPLRVAAVVSGGNAEPEQIEQIRSGDR